MLFGDEAEKFNGVTQGEGFLGFPNSAMYFDGVDDYADFGNTVLFFILFIIQL